MKTYRTYLAVRREFEREHRPAWRFSNLATLRALHAAWWFIENVPDDDPSRNDIFFDVRELVRAAHG